MVNRRLRMKFFALLLAFTFAGSHELHAVLHKCAMSFPKESRTLAIRDFSHLPPPGSPEFQSLAKEVRLQILTNRSFAMIDLRQWITPDLGEHWYQSMLVGDSSQLIDSSNRNNVKFLYQNTGPSGRNEYFDEPARPWQTAGVANLKFWFHRLLQESLGPEFPVNEGFSNTRLLQGSESGLRFDEWHLDGTKFNVAIGFKNIGPEILGPAPKLKDPNTYASIPRETWPRHCPGCQPRSTPEGYALIFFGVQAAVDKVGYPLIHKTPSGISERLLHIIRF